jgi:hypothetical protein
VPWAPAKKKAISIIRSAGIVFIKTLLEVSNLQGKMEDCKHWLQGFNINFGKKSK